MLTDKTILHISFGKVLIAALLGIAIVVVGATFYDTTLREEPRHLNQAIEAVRKQVDYLDSGVLPREFIVAVATMNHVQSRVSSINYGILQQETDKTVSDPEQALALQAGICGLHVATFTKIARAHGLKTRSVQFYYPDDSPDGRSNHIAVEVFYDDDWRLFDVTWGTFFREPLADTADVLSWERLSRAEDPLALAVTNETDLWAIVWQQSHSPFGYLHASDVDVVIAGNGVIRLQPHRAHSDMDVSYIPIHQPDYIGCMDLEEFGGVGCLSVVLPDARSRRPNSLHLDVTRARGDGTLVVQGESYTKEVDLSRFEEHGIVRIDLKQSESADKIRLSVDPDTEGGIAFVEYRSITLVPNETFTEQRVE